MNTVPLLEGPHRLRAFSIACLAAFHLLWMVVGADANGPTREPVWPVAAPNGDGTTDTANASMTWYPAASPNGTAIVVCPGGGYGGLALEPEGTGIARWLNSHGITAIVLEYRMPAQRHRVPLLDAQRTLRTVRSRASTHGIDPARIGIMGFSAGGHLAATASTHFDAGEPTATDPVERVSSRPDFAILVYPVVTMGEFTHGGSRQNLLGSNPSPSLIAEYSNELRVTATTPPVFLAHALDDTPVPPENSRQFLLALRRHGIPSVYRELESGGHGLNGYKGPSWDTWQRESLEWLQSLKPQATAATSSPPSDSGLKSQADFSRMFQQLSNWGRWGKEDEFGAANLITPAKRRQAAGLVREGISVSLARLVEKESAPDNGSPFQHWMDRAGTNNPGYSVADTFKVSYHGMVHTHLDSLCHMFVAGRMYNGFSQEEVLGSGARRLGVQNMVNGFFTRAVLVDVPRLRGVPYLRPGEAILPEDLTAWEKKTGLRVSAGDVLLVRTGRWARRAKEGAWGGSFAGLHGNCAPWLRERDIALLGSDAASDVLPSGVDGVAMPIHQLCLAAMGVWILDNGDFEAVAAACQSRQRWEFQFSAAPLAVQGATGSPWNPTATF